MFGQLGNIYKELFKKQNWRYLLLCPFAIYHVWETFGRKKSIKANIVVYKFHYKFPITLGVIVPDLEVKLFYSPPLFSLLPSLPLLHLHFPLLLSSPFFFLSIENDSIVTGKSKCQPQCCSVEVLR